MLQAAAVKLGLVARLGQNQVQSLMAAQFQTFCPVPPPPSEVCGAVTQTSPEPETSEPYRLVSRDGVASAAELQRIYEGTIAATRARYGPPVSTLRAARFLPRLGDPKRLRAWLAEHGPDERIAIRQHLKQKRAKPCPK